jgi:hypothetical protein
MLIDIKKIGMAAAFLLAGAEAQAFPRVTRAPEPGRKATKDRTKIKAARKASHRRKK